MKKNLQVDVELGEVEVVGEEEVKLFVNLEYCK